MSEPELYGNNGKVRKFVTEEEEREIRKEIDQWITVRGRGSSGRKLHIPDSENSEYPLCHEQVSGLSSGGQLSTSEEEIDWVSKDIEIYPVGYEDVCRVCGAVWREDI